ncbi:MAG: serine--tRNA ligase [Nitrospiria bacterium]
MLPIKMLRDDLENIKKGLALRNTDLSFDQWTEADRRQRQLKKEVETLKFRRNQASQEIPKLKKAKQPVDALINEMKSVSKHISEYEAELKKIESEHEDFLLRIPNLPHPSVPVGKSDADNAEIRRWGTQPVFSFEAKGHLELGESLGILDFERGAKIAGTRFVLYRGLGAQLERALINFMLDIHTKAGRYKEMLPPFIVNRDSMTGTGQLPKFEDDLFQLKNNDYLLIPTGEVPLTNIHANEILAESDLPLSYTAHTPCFRREAGSYGQDTRGLIRQHQFNKVELVKFCVPETSYALLEELVGDAENVLQKLRLPYRVVSLCTGDLGFSAAKTYDIEVWVPSQQKYREISSCSNFEDFQARRAKIRYRTEAGKVAHPHTLNGSGLAVGRTVVAILENMQQADGTVVIPEALRPYMGGLEKIS